MKGLTTLALILAMTAGLGLTAMADDTYCNGQRRSNGISRYYPNGRFVHNGVTSYYPNGQAMSDGVFRYYHNGRQVSNGAVLRYPNGQIASNGVWPYYPNGQVLTDGVSYFHPNGQRTDTPPRTIRYREGDWEYRFPIVDGAPNLHGFTCRVDFPDYRLEFEVHDGTIGWIEADCE